jgi:outer membrane lipoprotein-sorting protein
VGSRASLSWQTFITGTHSARVWVGGPDRQRVALIGELSEADVVHNGRDVWTYTSETNTVTHTVLPRAAGSLHTARSAPSAADLTPGAAAARVLKAISRSTSVTVGSSRMVADRPAYTLSIRPKDKRSTVREVTIAIDATKFVPLQVQIFGAGSSPAFEVGFATISFTTPAAATFRFKAPAGATSSSDPLEANGRRNHWHHGGPLPARTTHTPSAPKVIGSGWTSVLELPSGPASAVDNGMLRDLTSAVGTSGARLLHTALLNAVIMPDGRVLVGAVSPALLQHIAATRPR